ncbi:gamma-glutamylcyclotransferase [Bosea caraganae]|nr:gamma-glutamylcyclotransferase [Bosea caraganae]
MDKHFLTRELIESGGIDALVARDAPTMRVLSEAERTASLKATLAARPAGDAWLFGYGSLIWNPTIDAVERRTARIIGWHRAFCLTTMVGRGSAANPGLVLGLDQGGDCTGVAFRLCEEKLEAELAILWRREMLSGAYIPRWLDLLDEAGERFGSAIAFTIDPAGLYYAGGLEPPDVVRRLATASGALGSAADYLFQTCKGLHEHGIPDPALDQLAASVLAAQAAETGK